MPEIHPFYAWRYNTSLVDLKDVIVTYPGNTEPAEKFYENPHHSIHLALPSLEKSGKNIFSILKHWKEENILLKDPLPAIYVYYQYYNSPGTDQKKCSKGFIAMVRLHAFHEKIIFPHENVMTAQWLEQFRIMEESRMNINPVHCLYTDSDLQLESFMDESILFPIIETLDHAGTLHKISCIQDMLVIEKFRNLLSKIPLIIADGHHRYQAALMYQEKQRTTDPDFSEKRRYNFQCMYLTNTENNDFTLLPVHRLVYDLPDFNEQVFMEKINKYFDSMPAHNVDDIREVIESNKNCFGLILRNSNYLIRLKPGFNQKITWKFPQIIKDLDLTLIHYFIFEKCLEVKGWLQKDWKNINFSSNFTKSLSDVKRGNAQFAVITPATDIRTIKEVAFSVYTFPQKSTSFYPKLPSGIILSSLDSSFNKNYEC